MSFITLFKKYRITVLLTVIILLLSLVFPEAPDAQLIEYNHPELEWQTIETEHFFVHFHSGLSRTPRLIAKIAEEIYEPVTKTYRIEPDGKIHFIVRDHDDYSNGAAYYTDNKIEIWATPLDFLLRGTNNWLRNVVTHEFTHMIQLQAGMKVTRRIPAFYIQNFSYEDEKRDDVLYGFPNRLISYPIPGTMMPMWLAEGAAQYGSLKTGNDSWDSHRDMILRMHALRKGVYSLEDMGVFGKTSIGNESVYNHGFAFTLYLVSRFGEDILEKVSSAMASPFTFTVGKALKKATGLNGKSLHEEWKNELESAYRKHTDLISGHLVQGTLLDVKGTANVFPAWAPDNENITYLSNDRSDYISFTSLYLQKNGSSERKILDNGVGSPPSWGPSGRQIVYSKVDKNKNSSFFYDIFVYDLEEKKEKQLTDSRRATYPVFAPDGKTIYYILSADGIQNLYAFELESEHHRQVTDFRSGEEVFNLTVSPDGRQIVFAAGSGFGRDIGVVNADGSDFRYIIKTKSDERDPSFSPDGGRLYYSSDRTGIFNIYEYDFAGGQSRPVTNVLGGAFMPTVNGNGNLLYSLYTDSGYKLARIDRIEYVDPEDMVYEPVVEVAEAEASYDDAIEPQIESRKYDLQYMTTFFVPHILFDYGIPKLGLYSFSSDALDKYSIFLGVAINKDFDRDMFALFDYRRFRQTLFLELYNMTRHTSYFFPPNETDEITLGFWEADIGARERISETQRYEFRTMYGRQSANIKPIIPGILLKPLRYDYYKGLNFVLKWEYANILPRLDQVINPSYGRQIVLEYWRNYDEIFDNFVIDTQAGMLKEVYRKYTYNKFTIDWREHFGLPFLLERSALTLRFKGGFIDRPVDDFLYFFAGGLTGIKAYSFYSLEGRKTVAGSATFRFPLLRSIGCGFGPWYFDKLYASAGYQVGDAWSETKFDAKKLKKGIDLGLRLDMFSFYSFPTMVGFNAAYGFDKFPVAGRSEGQQWKYFLTVLFGYDF